MNNKYTYVITDELDPKDFYKFEKMSRDEINEWLNKLLNKKVDVIDWDLDIVSFKLKLIYKDHRRSNHE